MKPILRHLLAVWLGLLAYDGLVSASANDPVRLTREHVDLRIIYAPDSTNQLYLVARNEDQATNYASTNVVLVVREPAKTEIPPGFEEFGEPGSPFWVLPSSQDPELLYLGVSGEGLPRGVFEEPLAVRLIQVNAPGGFFVWQFDPGGTLAMKMDSRNGIGPEDAIPVLVGGHAHFNWGFASNGWFEVTFRVEGRLGGSITNLPAVETTFRFAVEPTPETQAEPAVLTNVVAADGQLRCDLSGDPGVAYRLQTSPDLIQWTDGPEVLAGMAPVPVSVPVPSDGSRFFLRALW